MNQTKRIEAYSIADFVTRIQEAVLEGYKINLEDNEKYPVQIGVGFYATLDKAQDTTLFNPNFEKEGNGVFVGSYMGEVEVIKVGQPVIKPGRKPKV